MRNKKLSVFDTLARALPMAAGAVTVAKAVGKLSGNQTEESGSMADIPYPEEGPSEDGRISMLFCPDPVTTTWDWSDFDPANPNDEPNLNLTVMGLLLATNIESTIGKHAWSLVENSLMRLGFTNIVHHYFETEEKINHAAMAFGRSTEMVNGKYVVAAVYCGGSSTEDFISDLKSEHGGFHKAGIAGTNELRAYCSSQKLTKENTILFITGHSYGAANASLVSIMSTDLAERDSIFCYSFTTPNYIRNGLTGEGMKMFSFDSNEDVVPQVPVGPNLDKTGIGIKYDRIDIKLNDPDRYERFLRLYKYFRHRDYDEDYDFMPEAYSFKTPVKVEVNNTVIRNHMPYTYMAFILSPFSDEVIDTYIGGASETNTVLDIEMYVGESYRLPIKETGLNPSDISWESSDASVASVNDKGMLIAESAGSVKLTAKVDGSAQAVLEVTVLAD